MSAIITAVRARGVSVPMAHPLHTGGGALTSVPLALLDLETDSGHTGRAYLFCYTPVAVKAMVQLLVDLGPVLVGQACAPLPLNELLCARFRLIATQGMTGMAMAAVDMAAWDLLGQSLGQPLACLLGAAPAAVRAYNSNGLGLRDDVQALAEEARALTDGGFGGIKLRLGYRDLDGDRRAYETVRAAVGDELCIMSDYNQCLSTAEAEVRVAALSDSQLYWIEEPVRADDYEGAARVRAASRIPIQLGESAWGPAEVHKSLRAGASDFYMPDVGKVGGVTGWLSACALAAAHGVPVSSHLYPEISVHLLAATPGRHWLEYVDWAAPILAEPVRVENGEVRVPQRPGHGMLWDEEAVARYRV